LRLIASIVTALVLVAVGGAQARSTAAISIAVTTNNKPVGGLQLATYGIPARITGTVGAGQSGVAVVLQASKFPFKAAFAAVGHATTAGGGAYSFSPKPTIATHYRVALASDPTSTSRTVTVYVVNADTSSFGCAAGPNGPVCNLRVKAVSIYPPAEAAKEGAKTVYFYVGVGYGPQTQHAARLNLVTTGSQRRVGSNRYQVNFGYSFPTPQAYHYNWVTCSKDTEPVDGYGLPGHHHCGDRTIPYPAYTLWVG